MGRHLYDAIGEVEVAQYRLRVPEEFLERGGRILRSHKLHQLYRVELVSPYETARVSAVSPDLTTEACRVRDVPDR